MRASALRLAVVGGFWGLVLGVAAPASAVDGVIEINAARAAAGGITASDTPGYPVTLLPGASYRLTSDLVISDDDLTVIEDDTVLFGGGTITLDLNGFSIRCTASIISPNCENGVGSGILFDQVANVTIMNGTVSGHGQNGIQVNTTGARIHNVHVVNNTRNAGVRCADSCLITNSVARNNLVGFRTDNGGAVLDSVAATNQNGISVGQGSLVSRTAVHDNFVGVRDSGGSNIRECSIWNNGGLGIATELGAPYSYGNNALRDNNGGGANPQVATVGIETGTNFCQTDTICP